VWGNVPTYRYAPAAAAGRVSRSERPARVPPLAPGRQVESRGSLIGSRMPEGRVILASVGWINLLCVLACGMRANATSIRQPFPPTTREYSQEPFARGHSAEMRHDSSAQPAEASRAGWLIHSDPQGRFRFSYPRAFGRAERGTNDGFGDRVAAIRFSQFSGGLQEGQIALGGEAVLTKGFVMLDLQAAGGLYDSMTLEVFPAPMRDSILTSLTPLTSSNLCQELVKEQHVDLGKSVFAALTPQQKEAITRMDRIRAGNPRVLRCDVAGDTVTFHKEVTAQFGQERSRQQIYGAVRFLKPPFSTFQLIRAGAHAPAPDTLRTMASVVDSFETP
jgi:hypothetical protein